MTDEKDKAGVADWWKSLALLAIGALGTGFLFVSRDLATGSQLNNAVTAEASLRDKADSTTRDDLLRLSSKVDRVDSDIAGIKATLETLTNVLKSPVQTR